MKSSIEKKSNIISNINRGDVFYIVGICGSLIAQLAVALKQLGFVVSGSDQGFYPPASDQLKRNNINVNIGYKSGNIPKGAKYILIGTAIGKNNPEYIDAINNFKDKSKIYYGFAGVLEDFFLRTNNIVVAGEYAKSTISSFIAYMLDKLGVNPTYAIGGMPIDLNSGVNFTDSKWGVFEGDEYVESKLDSNVRSKFFSYHPTVLLLTSANYDHIDIFKTEEEYVSNYLDLIFSMDKEAELKKTTYKVFLNMEGENIQKIYNGVKHLKNIDITRIYLSDILEFGSSFDDYTVFYIRGSEFKTKLIGKHNIRNLSLGIELLHNVLEGISYEKLNENDNILKFSGMKRRLEIIRNDKFILIDDFGHSPVKAYSSIQAVKDKYNGKKIIAVFEPHSYSFRITGDISFPEGFFNGLDEAIIAPVYHTSESDGITSKIAKKLNARYFNDNISLFEFFKNYDLTDSVVLLLSSGNIGGLRDYLMNI